MIVIPLSVYVITAAKGADSGNWSIGTCTDTAVQALADCGSTSLNMFAPGAPAESAGAEEAKAGDIAARVTEIPAAQALPELTNTLPAPGPTPIYVAPPAAKPVVPPAPAAIVEPTPEPAAVAPIDTPAEATDAPAPPAVPEAPASVTDSLFGDSVKTDSAATSDLFGNDDEGAC